MPTNHPALAAELLRDVDRLRSLERTRRPDDDYERRSLRNRLIPALCDAYVELHGIKADTVEHIHDGGPFCWPEAMVDVRHWREQLADALAERDLLRPLIEEAASHLEENARYHAGAYCDDPERFIELAGLLRAAIAPKEPTT